MLRWNILQYLKKCCGNISIAMKYSWNLSALFCPLWVNTLRAFIFSSKAMVALWKSRSFAPSTRQIWSALQLTVSKSIRWTIRTPNFVNADVKYLSTTCGAQWNWHASSSRRRLWSQWDSSSSRRKIRSFWGLSFGTQLWSEKSRESNETISLICWLNWRRVRLVARIQRFLVKYRKFISIAWREVNKILSIILQNLTVIIWSLKLQFSLLVGLRLHPLLWVSRCTNSR